MIIRESTIPRGFDPIDPDLDTTIEHAQKENVKRLDDVLSGRSRVGRVYFRTSTRKQPHRLSEEQAGIVLPGSSGCFP